MIHGTWQQTGGGGPGRGLLVVLGVLVLLGSGAAVELATAVVAALIAAMVVVVLTIAAGAVWLAWYARRGHLVRQAVAPPSWQQVPGAERDEVRAEPRRELAGPQHLHLHFHGSDPAEAAEAVRRAIGGE